MSAPTRITDTSATAANNSPTNSEVIGSNLDDYLRGIQAAFRGDLAYVGANIATAASPDLAAVQGLYHLMTGNTTVTSFVSSDAGIVKIIEAVSTVPLIHSTALPLIDAANMTLQPGEASAFISKGSSIWKQLWVNRGSTIPAGAVVPYAGTSAPTGWLLCYGQAVSRSTYAALFTAISTTYGNGDGSNTFNLPDLRGRVAVGKDDMGGSTAGRMVTATGAIDGVTLGATGGEQNHTLSIAEMPTHDHPADAGNFLTDSVGNAAGGGTVGGPSSSTTGNAGGGGAHNNVQPGIILNYIIKT